VSLEAATRAAVMGYLDALNGGDPDEIVNWVTDDFFNEHTSLRGTSLRGRAAYRQRLPAFLGEFRQLRYEVEALLVDGHEAAVAYRMTFSWGGPPGGPVPVAVRGMFRFEVADGLVAHRADYWDSASFDAQVAAGREA